jgi:hypothetical protein
MGIIKAEVKQSPAHEKTILSPEHLASIAKGNKAWREPEHSNAPSNRKRSKYLRAAFGPPSMFEGGFYFCGFSVGGSEAQGKRLRNI